MPNPFDEMIRIEQRQRTHMNRVRERVIRLDDLSTIVRSFLNILDKATDRVDPTYPRRPGDVQKAANELIATGYEITKAARRLRDSILAAVASEAALNAIEMKVEAEEETLAESALKEAARES